MQNMEKTREIALQQGMDAKLLEEWFARHCVTIFSTWRIPPSLKNNHYACILSLFAWLNKYYPEIGRNVLQRVLSMAR